MENRSVFHGPYGLIINMLAFGKGSKGEYNSK